MSLIENSSNILQLLHQKITISNYSSSIHLWQEEQELELRQSRNFIKIPQKLFESKSRGSSEKSEGSRKSVEIPQTMPAYRRNQATRVIPLLLALLILLRAVRIKMSTLGRSI